MNVNVCVTLHVIVLHDMSCKKAPLAFSPSLCFFSCASSHLRRSSGGMAHAVLLAAAACEAARC